MMCNQGVQVKMIGGLRDAASSIRLDINVLEVSDATVSFH